MARMIGSICSLIVCLIVYTTSAKTKASITKNLGDFGVVQKILDARAAREENSKRGSSTLGGMTVDDLESMMSKMCPMDTGMGVTLVDVDQRPKNQLNCYYEVPDDLNMTNPSIQKAAREWAIEQFDKKKLTEPTKELGITWNYVYRRSYGAVAFSMKIRPEDLGKPKTTSVEKQRSTLPTSLQQKISDVQATVKSHTTRSQDLLNSVSSTTNSSSDKKSTSISKSIDDLRFQSKVRKNANSGRTATGSNSGVISNPFVK